MTTAQEKYATQTTEATRPGVEAGLL